MVIVPKIIYVPVSLWKSPSGQRGAEGSASQDEVLEEGEILWGLAEGKE